MRVDLRFADADEIGRSGRLASIIQVSRPAAGAFPKNPLDGGSISFYNCMMTQISNRKPSPRLLCACLDAKVFKALCDPCRIGLLAYVACAGRPTTVTQAAACCPVDLSVVSRHLKILRDAGILRAEKRGKEVFYSPACRELAAALHGMADVLEACCNGGAVKPAKRKKEAAS